MERRVLIDKVRCELYKLKSDDSEGWVIIHGMGGYGKSTLAAEAVRDPCLLREVFPGGIFFLIIGQSSDPQALLSKMKSLLLMLGEKQCQPTSQEEAATYLRLLEHPRYLLILDDVWDPAVAEEFGFSSCVMVTSRRKDIASSAPVPASNVCSISIPDRFNDEEGMDLLGQWLQKDPKSLPSHANSILECCRGSPFAISLIGAMLRENPHVSRLKEISEKLVKENIGEMSKPSIIGDYKHNTVNASIKLSVSNLSEHLKSYFEKLVVLGYDVTISSKVLATLWGVDVVDTEKTMRGNMKRQSSAFVFLHFTL